ncbi:tetratricopeptide repeat protein, partial [Nostoc sp.]|uniref:tetratricopeptide repeat protein n=1 Tax=Nostoc sp. TaxID=1180 RepID=UPI002FFC142B
MKLKKLAMSSLRDATRSLLVRRSTTTCAHAVLLFIFGVACQSVDKVAIYEKNNGKQPVQAELLAKIAVGYAKLGQQDKASKLLAPAIQTTKISKDINITQDLLEQLGTIYVEMGQYDKALQVAKYLQKIARAYQEIAKSFHSHQPRPEIGSIDIRLKHITDRL